VLASLRATVLPQFTVEVYFDCEPDCRTHPRYVLVLRDGTAGAVELEFASARDLRAFLTRNRQALTECRFTAVQENESRPELYKLHCSKLSRGGRLAGRPRSWQQTNASVDERHCRQSSHCQIARASTAEHLLPPGTTDHLGTGPCEYEVVLRSYGPLWFPSRTVTARCGALALR